MLNKHQNAILKELPIFMRDNSAFREEVLSIARFHFADKVETESHFDRMMDELVRLRQQSERRWKEDERRWDENRKELVDLNQRLDKRMEDDRQKWAENEHRWDENRHELVELNQRLDKKMEEDRQKWAENERRWDENRHELVELNQKLVKLNQRLDKKMEDDRQKWAENERRWDENRHELVELNQKLVELNQRLDKKMEEDRQKWAENQLRWDENQQRLAENQRKLDEQHKEQRLEMINALQEQGKQFDLKYNQTLSALGARWGLHSEAAFRNGLAGILEEFSDVKVLNVNEYDSEGVVFGRPDQVELDIVIKNGLLMVCEIKSSMSKSDMYTFEKKVRFYERKHGRTVHKILVISPMVDAYALPVAEKLGIEVYSYVDEVNL